MNVRVERDPATELMVLKEQLSVSIILSRCLRSQDAGGRWLLRFDESLRPDLTIAVRMNETNDAIKDYYLFPAPTSMAAASSANCCNRRRPPVAQERT